MDETKVGTSASVVSQVSKSRPGAPGLEQNHGYRALSISEEGRRSLLVASNLSASASGYIFRGSTVARPLRQNQPLSVASYILSIQEIRKPIHASPPDQVWNRRMARRDCRRLHVCQCAHGGGSHRRPNPLIRLASRRGLEPLTPGLGNLCSIQLSYRDSNRRQNPMDRARPSAACP